MSWFRFRRTDKDDKIEAEWEQNIGNNVKFYNGEIDILNEYQPEDNNFFALVDEVIDNQIDPAALEVVVSKRNGKKRYYTPRKQIPKKVRHHLVAMRGFACENCQENGYSHIHHIDGNPGNNDFDNLRLLCIQCHKLIHKKKIC